MGRIAAPLAVALLAACGGAPPTAATVVNDVTGLNPIPVAEVLVPTRVEEIQAAVRTHSGPISIGGGRYSMGGQIATEGALFIDMRAMNQVVALSESQRTVTVQAGITWRALQEAIDPHGLSVTVMQTYANFTVGGALSVNAHGRYVGQGSVVDTVQAIDVVLADGSLVTASRIQNADLFAGCLGGYGALGVIVQATLLLSENTHVARSAELIATAEYGAYFMDHVAHDATAVFANGDIYPPDYEHTWAITWRKTDLPTLTADHLQRNESSWVYRFAIFADAELPGGKWLRGQVVEPWALHQPSVVWRNYEASYNVDQLAPLAGPDFCYALQEYFVPVADMPAFAASMSAILREHAVNALNISIRHARRDTTTLLAWAKQDSFAFVLYYKQGTSEAERAAVGVWTRALVDAALAHHGSYYLPYQIHATERQFHAAYPQAEQFFAEKRRVDPGHKFRNKLLDAYGGAHLTPP